MHCPRALRVTATLRRWNSNDLRHTSLQRRLPLRTMATELPTYGITLPNACQIVHGAGSKVKDPFTDIPVTLHELSPGSTAAFGGQCGFIEFDTNVRLPRHVHISSEEDGNAHSRRFLHERIIVVGGVALVELGGTIYVIPPVTLVNIAPGVPHTWTACPAGVNFSSIRGLKSKNGDNVVSAGTFLMLYMYEEVTGFFPTAQPGTLKSVDEYARCDDLESIRIPNLAAEEVRKHCVFVKDTGLIKG
ncbi:hypothetical protein GE09DRAFT_123945 [Coniochaeta sp. 2T2.1]|nr:hypothetical protein GE09DRAFT_123945 [Coniochaeta sp. 2T2.1]